MAAICCDPGCFFYHPVLVRSLHARRPRQAVRLTAGVDSFRAATLRVAPARQPRGCSPTCYLHPDPDPTPEAFLLPRTLCPGETLSP